MDYMYPPSPGSSVHGILQARIMEWVTIPFSRGSPCPRDWTWVSHIEGRFISKITNTYHLHHKVWGMHNSTSSHWGGKETSNRLSTVSGPASKGTWIQILASNIKGYVLNYKKVSKSNSKTTDKIKKKIFPKKWFISSCYIKLKVSLEKLLKEEQKHECTYTHYYM